MEFNFDNIDELSEEKIIEILRYNVRIASIKRSELKKYQTATSSSKIEIKEAERVVSIDENVSKIKKQKTFEEEVIRYWHDFQQLKGDYSEENLDIVLPTPDAENYKMIILRIISELLRELKDINEIIMAEEATMSKEELAYYKQEIVRLNNAREVLKKRIQDTEVVIPSEKKNRIIFVPMTSGKLRVDDEIKDIPVENYDLFPSLFESIKDGTFKGRSTFEVFHVDTLPELKNYQARVVYDRISSDCYVVISVFIKKSQNDKGYREAVKRKIFDYRAIEEELKEKLKDPEFLAQAELDEARILEMFNKNKDDNKGGAK